MKLSTYFLPTLKENPADAQIMSHQLMLRAGMICQESAGIYSWLPLGLKVLKNVEQIIREEMDKSGAIEILMPLLQSAELWQETNRYEAYGKEMLRIIDRHDRPLLFGPTAEEMVTHIFRRHVKSYKDLPKCLYQIHWKFRDEIRPRFGIMRGREFLMKDAYSFDMNEEQAIQTYWTMMTTYLNAFQRLGLVAIPVQADSGAIGGNLSHEFHVLADTGESQIYYDAHFDLIRGQDKVLDVQEIKVLYAMADDMHVAADCPLPDDKIRQARGIEVGHIFYYGSNYTKSMNASVMNDQGRPVFPVGGCYGIGVSRLVGAIIESSHDDQGIIWPESVAPFSVGLLNLKFKDESVTQACNKIYDQLNQQGISVLYDDTSDSVGTKFSKMDLIGLPWQIILGPQGIKDNTIELKNRKLGSKETVSLENIVSQLSLILKK